MKQLQRLGPLQLGDASFANTEQRFSRMHDFMNVVSIAEKLLKANPDLKDFLNDADYTPMHLLCSVATAPANAESSDVRLRCVYFSLTLPFRTLK